MALSSILVVDDDDAVRIVASEMLRTLDCDVSVAQSGPEALDCLKHSEFDLVLLDVGMPVMSGVEVYTQLRGNSPTQQVAFMTGYTEEEISEFESDYTTILPKPFSLRNLADLLESVL